MVVVFGANGMLGRYVCKVIENVKPITRADIDLSDFKEYSKLDEILEGATHVINCAGAIKSVMPEDSKAFMVNSVWPHYLGRVCEAKGIPVYHITTDCVYSGKYGGYTEQHPSRVIDTYGLSKSIGDSMRGCVIRTSIIGEEVGNSRSLIEWCKSKKGQKVQGYTNHLWNGVTCLQLAKILNLIIHEPYTPGLFHLYSETVTKERLLHLISDAFELDLEIEPVEVEPIYRNLFSVTKKQFDISLQVQINQLADFSPVLYDNNLNK